jgi:hypothetical protein
MTTRANLSEDEIGKAGEIGKADEIGKAGETAKAMPARR